MLSCSSIFEQQGIGVAQIEHHHRIGNRCRGDVDPGLGDDQGSVGSDFVSLRLGLGKDNISRLFLMPGIGRLFMPVIQPALVTAQRGYP